MRLTLSGRDGPMSPALQASRRRAVSYDFSASSHALARSFRPEGPIRPAPPYRLVGIPARESRLLLASPGTADTGERPPVRAKGRPGVQGGYGGRAPVS